MVTKSYLSSKGAWIPSNIRYGLMSLRPWSVTASLVPSVLAVAIVYNSDTTQIYDIVLPILAGIAAHFGANTTNTYYDYKKGLDKKETSDDRGLVDNTVTLTTVKYISLLCYFIAGAISVYYAYVLGSRVAYATGMGLLLAFLYTADPLSLKYHGLGDIIIFICFGPLLMLCTSAAVTRDVITIPWNVLYMSLPLGGLTTAILHANNTRDMDADKKAGARTLAQILGFQGSYYLYVSLFVSAYFLTGFTLLTILSERYSTPNEIITPVVMVNSLFSALTNPSASFLTNIVNVLQNGLRSSTSSSNALAAMLHAVRGIIILIVTTVPWCLVLIRRFQRKALSTLPQSTAQFNLLFGACCFGALLPFSIFARLCLGVLFYLGGVNNLLMWHHTSLLVYTKLNSIIPFLPKWLTNIFALSATFIQLLASVIFVLNYQNYGKEAAVLLSFFLLPVTVTVHNLWSADFDEVAELENIPEGARKASTLSNTTITPIKGDESKGISGSTSSSVRKRSGSSTPSVSRTPVATPTQRLPLTSSVDNSTNDTEYTTKYIEDSIVPTFVTDFDNEFVHFFKNIGMLGGLLVYIAYSNE